MFCGTACGTQTALRAFFPPAIPPERDIKKTGTRKKDRTDGGLRDAQAEEGFFCGSGKEHIGFLEKPDAMYKYFLISNGPAASVIGDPCVQQQVCSHGQPRRSSRDLPLQIKSSQDLGCTEQAGKKNRDNFFHAIPPFCVQSADSLRVFMLLLKRSYHKKGIKNNISMVKILKTRIVMPAP